MSLRQLIFGVVLATALPMGASAFAQSSTPAAPATGAAQPKPAPAPATAPAAPASPSAASPSAAKPSGAKTPSAGQQAAHQRQAACGAEWRTAKEAGKIPAGQTWPQYWSACNKRLKAQGK